MKKILVLILILISFKITYSQTAKEFVDRGVDKADTNDFIGAIEDVSKAIKINPKYAEAYYNRGFSKSTNRTDYTGAIEDFTKAIEIYPEYAEAYYNRGVSKTNFDYHNKGLYKGAIADFTKAIELNATYEEAYYNRGLSKVQIDKNSGCLDLNKALELGYKIAKDELKKYCD